MRANGEAPGVIAEEAKRLRAALVHFSTDYVFDGMKEGAYVEDDAMNPQNVYGKSKMAGEQAIGAAGCDHLILRTSWVYGTRGRNFLLTMLRLGEERDELSVVADQTGAPTWAKTIAALTSHIVAQGVGADADWWKEVGRLPPYRVRFDVLAGLCRGDLRERVAREETDRKANFGIGLSDARKAAYEFPHVE